ncbi:MAG: helix-turn-helix transcriptional regulator [Spirochaetales bacterium]
MARLLFFLQLITALVVLPLWPGLDANYLAWGLVSLGSVLFVSAGAVVAVFGPRAGAQALADAWSHEPLGPSRSTSLAVWDLVSRSFPIAGALGALLGLIGPLTNWSAQRGQLAGTFTLLFFALVWAFLGLLISRILRSVVSNLGRSVAGPSGNPVASAAPGASAPLELSATVAQRFGLTPREAEAARSLLDGLTYSDAAATLGISPSTLKTHILSVYQKTGTGNKVELLRLVEAETARLMQGDAGLHQKADGATAGSGRS